MYDGEMTMYHRNGPDRFMLTFGCL